MHLYGARKEPGDLARPLKPPLNLLIRNTHNPAIDQRKGYEFTDFTILIYNTRSVTLPAAG